MGDRAALHVDGRPVLPPKILAVVASERVTAGLCRVVCRRSRGLGRVRCRSRRCSWLRGGDVGGGGCWWGSRRALVRWRSRRTWRSRRSRHRRRGQSKGKGGGRRQPQGSRAQWSLHCQLHSASALHCRVPAALRSRSVGLALCLDRDRRPDEELDKDTISVSMRTAIFFALRSSRRVNGGCESEDEDHPPAAEEVAGLAAAACGSSSSSSDTRSTAAGTTIGGANRT